MWHHESGAEKEVAMPWLAADPVIVLPADREALEALVRAHSTSQQLVLRARTILHAADNIGVRESARELDVWPKTVRYWRGRWRQAPAAQSVSERLADAPRSGAPATYTPEQICAVIAMTCEKRRVSGRSAIGASAKLPMKRYDAICRCRTEFSKRPSFT
jgi:hypothetical protein